MSQTHQASAGAIKLVTTLAFVAPVFDVDMDKYVPVHPAINVGYWIFQWDLEEQRWEKYPGIWDDKDAAHRIARELHFELAQAAGVFP